jgi:hypothetical protein
MQTLWLKQSVVYNAETTIHTEEAATLSMVYDVETTTHIEEVVTLCVVCDVETTTHTRKICYTLPGL